MPRFEIIGNHRVAGKGHGQTVELDLPDDNVRALIESGHIRPVPKRSPKKQRD